MTVRISLAAPANRESLAGMPLTRDDGPDVIRLLAPELARGVCRLEEESRCCEESGGIVYRLDTAWYVNTNWGETADGARVRFCPFCGVRLGHGAQPG